MQMIADVLTNITTVRCCSFFFFFWSKCVTNDKYIPSSIACKITDITIYLTTRRHTQKHEK